MANGRTVAIMQPYFFPYIGYWQLIYISDTFVIYDDVNFIKNGWINRNRVLNKTLNLPEWLTLELIKASPNKLINQIEIGSNKQKLLNKITTNYGRAPYYKEIFPCIEKFITYDELNLSLFLENTIISIAQLLGIETKKILRSSLIEKNASLKGEEKVLDICTKLGGDIYVNSIGGQELYRQHNFAEKGVTLKFLASQAKKYAQFSETFVENLSIIDVLMFNDSKNIKQMLQQYTLL